VVVDTRVIDGSCLLYRNPDTQQLFVCNRRSMLEEA